MKNLRGLAELRWRTNVPVSAGKATRTSLEGLNRTPDANYQTFKKGIEHPDPAICANVIAGLIKVTCYLLGQQLCRLERDFLNEGGLR
jgi:four helix bundle suffix protein